MKKVIPWVLVGYIVFVFVQSLVFKFSGSEQTVIIFTTVADWMRGYSLLAPVADAFAQFGGNVVGAAELVASGLLVFGITRIYGAIMAMGIISGAIFFHLFTPLGVNRIVDAAGNTDGGVLFMMACGVWLASVALIWLNRRQLPFMARG